MAPKAPRPVCGDRAAAGIRTRQQHCLTPTHQNPQYCTSWRDRIAVHPAAAVFREMFDDELYGLAKDIAENELQHGVVLWTPEEITKVGRKGPKEVYLLDWRNRLEAIERNF